VAPRSDAAGPRRNRVTPLGEIVAIELRGAWTGNRGILHGGAGGEQIVRFHASDLWITCALSFRGWHHEQWRPGHLTWLFFHDEAVSLAAGHRPCALCRRDAYEAFRHAWADGLGGSVPSAAAMNRQLHAERIVRGTHRRRLYPMPWAGLPDAAFVLDGGGPALVLGERVVPWTSAGYGTARTRPRHGEAEVITPPSIVAALRAGYRPQLDAGARPG
jgi:hypothetical protein